MADIEDILRETNQTIDFDETTMINLLEHLKVWLEQCSEKYNDKNDNELFAILKNVIVKEIQKFCRPYKIQVKKTVLLYYYNKFVAQNKFEENDFLRLLLMKKPSNDISGINQITILTSAHPDGQSFSCKHDCFYCPNEPAHEGNGWVDQPRSYLFQEPAVLRANRNNFDPFLQTKNRLDALLVCGHKCDKLEFIIEGGTFTEYPKKYLERFFTSFIYCVNTYFDQEKRDMLDLQSEIRLNKLAKARIIGICIETRPDAILEKDDDGIPWIKNLLMWGVTRIQLGVQHTDNFILKKINRGHTIEKVMEAIEICKNNCFKIDIHLMPDLPYSSPEKDISMIDDIYKTSNFQPDQIKIYPCEVVPWTKIKKWYEEGKYKPYGENKELIKKVLHYAMTTCPPWIRLPRVVRDIPDEYINGGMKCGNMRQILNENITNSHDYSMDLRFREIGRHPEYTMKDARLNIRKYEASNGTEYFISYETYDNRAIYGFLRLRINNNSTSNNNVMYNESIMNSALIRELHVYGSVQRVFYKNRNKQINNTQHNGIGKRLLKTAEMISCMHMKQGVVVISGIGVRNYYEKNNYTYENNYMKKYLSLKNYIFAIIYYLWIVLFTKYNYTKVLF
jgi:ELP3 family radical SAM enzyme/protein acetyltransferase